jgi:protein gp37
MAQSHIEWTEMTWNPVTGCDKLSDGCRFCYAEAFAKRLQGMGVEKYQNGFKLTLHPETLREPFKWKKPRVVFVNSMGDLFHKDIPLDYVRQVFSVMHQNPHHVFQVLTKRADVLRYYDSEGLHWSHNIWMGVSVEKKSSMHRIDQLRETGARVKFLSCEPLLGQLPEINLQGIDWVIVGGESGRNARPIKAEWVQDIREQCLAATVPFFFKQWGGFNKKKAGRMLDGRVWDQTPVMPEQYGNQKVIRNRN